MFWGVPSFRGVPVFRGVPAFRGVPVFRRSGLLRSVPAFRGVSVFRRSGVFRCSGVPAFRGVPVFLILVHASNIDLFSPRANLFKFHCSVLVFSLAGGINVGINCFRSAS